MLFDVAEIGRPLINHKIIIPCDIIFLAGTQCLDVSFCGKRLFMHKVFRNKIYIFISISCFNAYRPCFAIEYKQIPFIFKAIIALFPIYVLKTINQTIMNNALLIPEALSQRRILLIDVLNVELFIFFIF